MQKLKTENSDINWSEYSEELGRRGEFFLELEWVKSWDKELEEMNEGKRGAPYKFPNSLIFFQALWYQYVDYRAVEGITRKLCEMEHLPDYNDFSTLQRRINKLGLKFELPKDKDISVTCDSTGMEFTNGGRHRERIYGKKRKKYIKVTIISNPETREMIDFDVSIEGEGPSEPEIAQREMERLMSNGISVSKFWGDGSFDTHDLFRFLEEEGIESAVKLRKDAVESEENSLRDREIRELKEKGYEKWSEERDYGLRWNATEGIFSSVKRKFGERVRSTKPENALQEVRLKFWLYREMKKYGKR